MARENCELLIFNKKVWLKNYTKVRVCKICAKEEIIRRDSKADTCKTCAARKANAGALKVIRANTLRINCKQCGEEFKTRKSAHAIFCSKKCWRYSTHIERTCRTCGKSFHASPSKSSAEFCTRICYENHLRIGGVQGRRKQLKKEIAQQAIDAAPFCGRCGQDGALEVHHIIPWRVTADDSQDNLMPLCHRCHKIVEYETSNLLAAAVPHNEIVQKMRTMQQNAERAP